MDDIFQFMKEYSVVGFNLSRLALALLLILAGITGRKILSSFILKRLASLARRTQTDLDDLIISAVSTPTAMAIVLAGVGFGVSVLALPSEPVNVRGFIFGLLIVLITLNVVWLIFRLIDALAIYFSRMASTTDSDLDDALVPLFRKSLKVFIGVIAFVLVVQNMGYSVSGLLAGLGVGGLAVALAAKDTLANVFGSITILLDRPFRVGDWIKTNQFEGIVEEIGFRSTRIRTFPKTLVVIPNNALVNMMIDNHQEMPMRRIWLVIGVTYDATATQLGQLVNEIEGVIKTIDGVLPENQAVRFADFGGSSLDLQVKCFTRATDWTTHTAVRQELLLAIMEKLAEMGLEIAFPSQTVYFGKEQTLSIDQSRPE